jgi:hypothetical protein
VRRGKPSEFPQAVLRIFDSLVEMGGDRRVKLVRVGEPC